LKANYNGKLTASQLLDGLKEGLAQATNDPYTEYFNPDQAKQFSDELNNSFSGIGAVLGKDDQGNVIIISPIKGFPADKAGLKPKDVIVSINGQSTASMPADVAASDIRGPKDTVVTLKILRGRTQTLTFKITRDNIQLPSVTTKTLPGNIGYMEIRSFADDTSSLAIAAARKFAAQHVKGIILDLRGDPGGLLDAAIQVSSLWLPDGKTVVTEKGTDGTQIFTANADPLLQGIPTVVLIDDGSASASEITAGALHDNGAAYLIGTQSFGKGVVQQLVQFGDGSELKVTVASWYRPNGQNINKKGITPDKVVAPSSQSTLSGNDVQLKAAEGYLSE
jgi:carboxyl-terminal processing protease